MPTFTNLDVFGHSYAAASGSGASDDAHTWVKLLQAQIGSPTLNRRAIAQAQLNYNGSFAPPGGVAGQDTTVDIWRNFAPSAASPGTSRPGLMTVFHGLNDLRTPTSIPVAQTLNSMRAYIAGLLTAAFYDDNNGIHTYTSFTNNTASTYNHGTTNRGTATNGAKDAFSTPASFPGGTLVVFVMCQDTAAGTGKGAAWRVRIGGVDVKSETIQGATNSTGGSLMRQGCILVPNVAAGSGQAVEVFADTIFGSAAWVDGIGWIKSDAPPLLLFKAPLLTLTGYGNGGFVGSKATNDAVLTTWNNGLDTLAAEFVACGCNVKTVDLSAMDANTSYFEALEFHPNDTGHAYIAAQALAALASSFTRSASDTCSVADAVTKTAGHPRATADTLGLSDAPTRSGQTFTRATADTLGASDTATRAPIARVATAADSVSISDAAARSALSFARSSADTLSTADAATRTSIALIRGAADAVSATDAATRILSTARASTDTIAAADVATRTTARARSATDTVSVSDALEASAGVSRTATDSVTIGDAATRTSQTFSRTASDITAASDVAGRTVGGARAASDTVTIADVAVGTQVLSYTRSAADAVAIAEAITRAVHLDRAGTDVLTVGDVAARGATAGGRSAGDALTLADAVVRYVGASRAAADALTVTEVATGAGGDPVPPDDATYPPRGAATYEPRGQATYRE